MTDQATPISTYMLQMAENIAATARSLNKKEADVFFNEMLSAKRIYVTGAGRSGFVAKAFAMRLMHLGFDAYVVGETVTPAFSNGDTLVAFSGSGETNSVVDICEIAKEIGGRVCLVTAAPASRMGRIADCVVDVGDLTGYYRKEGATFEVRQITGQYRSVTSAFAPLGTLFETLALVFSDAVISAIMEVKKADVNEMKGRLSNVQ
ncbi:MAG: 3-hexulose-6-phosphate isomerase [Methanoregula sp. PtaU1.Bin051]|nr:MAG: 3-hexulose-6-phosphate isomerase [Methanoregula sp. PtaU1.Bin051]